MFIRRTTDYLGMNTGNFLARGGISDHLGTHLGRCPHAATSFAALRGSPGVGPGCGLSPCLVACDLSPVCFRRQRYAFASGDQMRASSVSFGRHGEAKAGGLIRQACSEAVGSEGAQKRTLPQSVVGRGFSVRHVGHNLRCLDRLQAIARVHFFVQARHVVFDGTHF